MTVRGITRTGVAALLAVGLLAGCTGDDDGSGGGGEPTATPGGDEGGETGGGPDGEAAEGGAATLGGDGSACPLPVTFDIPAEWAPERLELDADEDSALVRRDGVGEVVCEIDAKPEALGYLRVWVGEPTDAAPLDLAETFVAGERAPVDPEYRETEVGGLPAVEAVYANESVLDEETVEGRALVVPTPEAVVVLSPGGFDTEEHRLLLPGYELAKETLRAD